MAEQQKHFERGLISVIAGNYNTPADYIIPAIESVLTQSYQNFEFIIVDDASTDNSLEVIKLFKDPRIKIYRSEKNGGLASALNKALDICQGEYVARMDLDDICLPDRFKKQVAFMHSNRDVILCGTQIRYINEYGDSPLGDRTTRFFDDPELYRIYLLFANNPMIIHPTWMMNHRMLEKYGIRYDECYKYSQDYAMLVTCAAHGRCAVIPDVLLKYRIHSYSASSTNKMKQRKYDYEIIQKQLDALHLTLPNDLKEFHHRYMQKVHPYGKDMRNWLDKIIKANEIYRVFDQKKLKKLINEQWQKNKLRVIYHKLKRG